MAWTQSDIDAIDTAIKSSTLRVRYGDREVEYRSMTELLQARTVGQGEISKNSGTPINRQIRIVSCNGW